MTYVSSVSLKNWSYKTEIKLKISTSCALSRLRVILAKTFWYKSCSRLNVLQNDIEFVDLARISTLLGQSEGNKL